MLADAIVLHLIADFVFQNDWIARNKSNIFHKAASIHAFIHFLVMLFVFPLLIAIAIAIIHMLIDTRYLANWWQRVYGQTTEGEYSIHVSIWLDQTFHFVVLMIFAAIIQYA